MYFCAEIPPHDCVSCSTELGRVRRVALVNKTYYNTLMADVGDQILWDTGIQQMKIFTYECNGEYDGGNAKLSRGFGRAVETLDYYSFRVKITVPDYAVNFNHWNRLKGYDYYLIFCTETVMFVTQRPVVIVPNNPIANDLKAEVLWNIELRWLNDETPMEYDITPDVFGCGWTYTAPSYRLLEDGYYRLLEDGYKRLLE